MHQE
jgi:hypothetical protein